MEYCTAYCHGILLSGGCHVSWRVLYRCIHLVATRVESHHAGSTAVAQVTAICACVCACVCACMRVRRLQMDEDKDKTLIRFDQVCQTRVCAHFCTLVYMHMGITSKCIFVALVYTHVYACLHVCKHVPILMSTRMSTHAYIYA